MSATGRGARRKKRDFYETPAWCTHAILGYLVKHTWIEDRSFISALEPACGSGAISDVLLSTFNHRIKLCEFDLSPKGNAKKRAAFRLNFLKTSPTAGYDLVISNPPYSLAEEFIKHSLRWVHDDGKVAMLLRLNFLESQKRASWLRQHTPDVYVLPRRPSFTGGGTDATAYAWMVWHKRSQLDGPFARPAQVQILSLPK